MPYTLSPSSLSLFKNCPRCFWLQCNKGLTRPAGLYASLPFGMDKALKKRFDYFREKGTLPPELYKLGNGLVLFDNVMLALWRNNKQGIRWKDERGILCGEQWTMCCNRVKNSLFWNMLPEALP